MKSFIDWLKVLFSGKPHFIIGETDNPYMLRWHIIPRNKFLCIYLHKFLRDDDDRALHDHPWNFVSVMLKGSYDEYTPEGVISRSAPSVAYRKADHQHRVELRSKACWTLVFRGSVIREWGFWCPQGFVHWKVFTAPDNPGEIGRGCGEI
jgi:hypothetical protein